MALIGYFIAAGCNYWSISGTKHCDIQEVQSQSHTIGWSDESIVELITEPLCLLSWTLNWNRIKHTYSTCLNLYFLLFLSLFSDQDHRMWVCIIHAWQKTWQLAYKSPSNSSSLTIWLLRRKGNPFKTKNRLPTLCWSSVNFCALYGFFIQNIYD